MNDTAVHVQGVCKAFGSVQALDGVSLDAPRGEVFGLLGPNGAGKTTLVRILTTLLMPDQGEATVLGHDVRSDREALRPRIGLAGQYAPVDENLTGRENLVMVGRLYHLGRAEAKRRANDVLERFQLQDAAGRSAKTYSGGTRRRLDLAASLVGRPEVLFLDEPTTGLDPRSRRDMWALIKELVGGGATLLLTTQYLEEADELDRAALRISVPAPESARTLLESVRRLDAAGVDLVDIGLRRPSLDEVFLSLTGHQATGVADGDGRGADGERGREDREGVPA